jgi:hypothetical protein
MSTRAQYMAEYHARNRGRKYGLTPEQYDELEAASGGLCAICEQPPSGKRDRLMIDHCHATNRVREMLCLKCNVALGLLGEDPALMVRAALYIRKHRAAA